MSVRNCPDSSFPDAPDASVRVRSPLRDRTPDAYPARTHGGEA